MIEIKSIFKVHFHMVKILLKWDKRVYQVRFFLSLTFLILLICQIINASYL